MTIHDQDDVRLLKPTREIWSEAQKTLVKKMSQPSFESWIRPSQLIDYNKGIAKNVKVNYQPVGSGGGIQQFTAGTHATGSSARSRA